MSDYIGVYVALCICVALLAWFRGRSAFKWFVSSLLLTPLLSIVLLLAKANNSARHAHPVLGADVVNSTGTPLFTWPKRDEYAIELIGVEFYQTGLQIISDKLLGDQSAGTVLTAMLVPEDSNRHDDTAVRVEIEGLTVGYLSLADSKGYGRRMTGLRQKLAPTACAAKVLGKSNRFRVKLDIKQFN